GGGSLLGRARRGRLADRRRGEAAATDHRPGALVPERGRLPGRGPAGALRASRVPAPSPQAAPLDEPAGAVIGGSQAAGEGDRPLPWRDELPELVLGGYSTCSSPALADSASPQSSTGNWCRCAPPRRLGRRTH